MRIPKLLILLIVLLFPFVSFAQKTPAEYGFKASVAPLLGEIHYGQDTPFNGKCPVMEKAVYQGSADRRAHTGCAATAMSAILKFHEYPTQPTGLCHYTSKDSWNANNTFEITNDLSDHSYDWSLILPDYHGDYTPEQADAVAQLMFDCGSTLNMQYTSFTSDAGHRDVAKALTTNFGYDLAGMQTWYRNTTSDELWRKVIYSEIAAGRPVIIQGFPENSAGGHEYIVDGYDEKGRLHVNFGNNDGGKYLPVYEHEIYTANFSIITGIQPAKSGGTGSPIANVHRLNNMKYMSGNVAFRLRNDGLAALGDDSQTQTALAIVREGKIVGLCGATEQASTDAQKVVLRCLDDEEYSFSVNNWKSLHSNATYPSTCEVTFNPADIFVQDIQEQNQAIHEGDILVPLLSTDNGKTWDLADGHEDRINSLRVKAAPFAEGYYIIYNDKHADEKWAMTANGTATAVTTANYNADDISQIFQLQLFGQGYHILSYASNQYLLNVTANGKDVKLTSDPNQQDVGVYSIVPQENGYYTLTCGPNDGNYLLADNGHHLYGGKNETTGYHLWRLEATTPKESATTVYNIYYHGCPYGPGVNRFVEYKYDQYADVLECTDSNLTADQLTTRSKAGYIYRIWVRHAGATHEIHVTHSLVNITTCAAQNVEDEATHCYNIVMRDGSLLYNNNGELAASSSILATDADATWVVVASATTIKSSTALMLYNKGLKGYLCVENGALRITDGASTKRNFYMNTSLDTGWWLLNNASGTASSYIMADEDKVSILSSDEAIWGEGGTISSAIKHGEEHFGMDATKLQFIEVNDLLDNIYAVPASATSDIIYDLQGCQVSQPQQGGIYIKNGRKFRLF